jgi:hypothetical protein
MKMFIGAIAAAFGLTIFAAVHAQGAPLVAPCSRRLHAIAGVGPCFGSVGTTLTVTIFAKRPGRLTALRFEPPQVASVLPEPATTPLLGSGRTRTALAPRELCNAGNDSRWQVWLMGPFGQKLGRIGDFTVICCAQSNAH